MRLHPWSMARKPVSRRSICSFQICISWSMGYPRWKYSICPFQSFHWSMGRTPVSRKSISPFQICISAVWDIHAGSSSICPFQGFSLPKPKLSLRSNSDHELICAVLVQIPLAIFMSQSTWIDPQKMERPGFEPLTLSMTRVSWDCVSINI